MNVGIWQILLIAVVVILLFGRGKISDLMGDVAKGIKSFKKGISEDEKTETAKNIEDGSGKTTNMANQEKTGTS